MGRAEWAAPRQLSVGQFSRQRRDHADIQHLARIHGWQDGGQTLGQHRLACARRPYHEEMVSAGGGHLHRPFSGFLSLDVLEVG